MTARPTSASVALSVAGLGIALYCVMDALMKGLSISIGAYNAALWRTMAGTVMTGVLYALRRQGRPSREAMKVHAVRGVTGAAMIVTFFWGIARVPLAEGIALSFIAPLITLYLAAVLLGEKVTRWSVISSLIGLSGVGVIMAGRFSGAFSPDAALCVAAILVSAVIYAVSLILQRRQSQLALPEESAFFGATFNALSLLLFAPLFGKVPPGGQAVAIFAAAVFASAAALTLSWAYRRAEAKVLVVVEYTAFIWAAVLGLLVFHEPVTLATFAGAVLIVMGCLVSAWHERGHQPSAEAGL